MCHTQTIKELAICARSFYETVNALSVAHIKKQTAHRIIFLEIICCTVNSGVLIGQVSFSTSRQTHEFINCAKRQQARADNSTICYGKKNKLASVFMVCPVFVCQSIATLTML